MNHIQTLWVLPKKFIDQSLDYAITLLNQWKNIDTYPEYWSDLKSITLQSEINRKIKASMNQAFDIEIAIDEQSMLPLPSFAYFSRASIHKDGDETMESLPILISNISKNTGILHIHDENQRIIESVNITTGTILQFNGRYFHSVSNTTGELILLRCSLDQ